MPSYNISTSPQTSSAFFGTLYDSGGSGGNYADNEKMHFAIAPSGSRGPGWVAKNLNITIHSFAAQKSSNDIDNNGGTLHDYMRIRSNTMHHGISDKGTYWRFFRDKSNVFAVQRVEGSAIKYTQTGTFPFTIRSDMLDMSSSKPTRALVEWTSSITSETVGAGWHISWSSNDFYTGSYFNTVNDPGRTKYNAGVIPLDASGTKGTDGIIVELNKFAQHNYDKSTPQAPFSFMQPGPFTLRQRSQAYAPNKGTKLEKVFKERK